MLSRKVLPAVLAVVIAVVAMLQLTVAQNATGASWNYTYRCLASQNTNSKTYLNNLSSSEGKMEYRFVNSLLSITAWTPVTLSGRQVSSFTWPVGYYVAEIRSTSKLLVRGVDNYNTTIAMDMGCQP
jgi:hypothetical protein